MEEPTLGGSYLRNADGSLTLTERTAEREPGFEPQTPPPAADSTPQTE